MFSCNMNRHFKSRARVHVSHEQEPSMNMENTSQTPVDINVKVVLHVVKDLIHSVITKSDDAG